MSSTATVFDLEVSIAYLMSVVSEMTEQTARSAYSTCFSEGEDFTCGILDRSGRLVVQAAGLPIQSGSLVDGVRALLQAFSTIEPGDIMVHNDPYNGGSHQADVLIAEADLLRWRTCRICREQGTLDRCRRCVGGRLGWRCDPCCAGRTHHPACEALQSG